MALWCKPIVLLTFTSLASTTIALKLDVFASNTVYWWTYNRTEPVVKNSGDIITYVSGECKAIHVHGVVRHGTKYPTVSNIEKVNKLFQKLESSNTSSSKGLLSTLTRNVFDVEKGGSMIALGLTEMRELGFRVATRFFDLLDGNRYAVRTSRIKRIMDSSKEFRNSLLNVLANSTVSNVMVNDSTIRFWEGCYNYEHTVTKNETNFDQFQQYSMTTKFQRVKNSVESKLGLTVPLSPADVYLMYDLCAYEKVLFVKTPWCDIMSDADRAVLEYGKDLQIYYGRSFGNPMNAEVACPLLKDMFQTLDSAIANTYNYSGSGKFMHTEDYLAGKFQVGHLATLVPLLTALRLFKDDAPLLATNSDAMANRQFRISHIAPYSASIVFALYICPDADNTAVMKMLFNEEPIVIPACGDLVCPYQHVKEYYRDQLDSCNIKELCGTEPSGPSSGGGKSNRYRWCVMTVTFILISLNRNL